jgi:hypothetical protein
MDRFMSSEALQTFRRDITPGKNDSFDALSNQLISACAEICQKHKVNLNYGNFSNSFQNIVKEYIRGDFYSDKGAIIADLKINGTPIEKSIIECLEKHVNRDDKLKIFLKHDQTYYNLSIMKTNGFKKILKFIESSTFKNKVQEVSQQSNLFKHEIPKEIKPDLKREENDRYNSKAFQLVQKHEIPKEQQQLLKNRIKQEILSNNVVSIVKRISKRIPQEIRKEISKEIMNLRDCTYLSYLEICYIFQDNKYFSEIEKMLLMNFLTTTLEFLEKLPSEETIFINKIIENDECSNPFPLQKLPKDFY